MTRSRKQSTPPHILFYDPDKYVLQMNYVGNRTLKEVYTDSAISIAEWGDLIGTWLARLHQQTKFTDIGKNTVAALLTTIWELELRRKEYGHDKGLGERTNAKYGSLLATDDEYTHLPQRLLAGKAADLGGQINTDSP